MAKIFVEIKKIFFSKQLFFAFFSLLLFAGVNALSISAEQNIPAGTQWSFPVTYSLPQNSDLKLYLDDELIFNAFERAGNVYVDEAQKSQKVLAYNISKEQLILSLAGMNEQLHSIKATISSNNTVLDSALAQVNFSKPLTSSEKQDLYTKVSSLESTINSQKETINQLQTNLDSKQTEINNLTQKNSDLLSLVDAVKRRNSELMDSINQINSEVSSLQENDKTKQESLEKLSSDINAIVAAQEEKQNALSGMLAFSSSGSIIFGTVLLLALVIVGGALYFRNKKPSLYSK
jgi:cobalamin biosynthesis Mg chelatase CobN